MLRSASAIVLLALALVTPGFAQSGGAIFTTNRSGDAVNGNIYRSKSHVYLSGGPGPNSPCTSAGLPDGTYYFQVTNPSGSVLLSGDPVSNRILVVSGGIVTAHLGTHRVSSAACNSLSVQLVPFNDTPSSSGEYKVWMTKVENYSTAGEGSFGFLSKFSKTDNFKVQGSGRMEDQSIITGYKFYDFTGDGIWDPMAQPLEVPIPGWRIEIYRDGIFQDVTFTDDLGRYQFIRDQDGATYEIREVAPSPGFVPEVGARWVNSTPLSGLVATTAAEVAGPVFGNFRVELAPGVGRTKGFWSNNNGRDQLSLYDPAWREALNAPNGSPLCLRRNISTADPLLSIFTIPLDIPFADAHFLLADWIVGNPALGHGGFILSTQVAAAVLNNTAGFMQGNAYIDRFQDDRLVSFESMVEGVKTLLCDPRAGLTGPNDGNDDLRNAMLNCLNEFASINESGDLSKPQVVYLPQEEYEEFSSPY